VSTSASAIGRTFEIQGYTWCALRFLRLIKAVLVEMKRLSSAQTFTAKWIFPVFWISMFGFGTLSMWLEAAPNSTAEDPRLEFLVAWIVGTVFILLSTARLKRVRIDAHNIYVSNYVSEVAIPIANICDVTENRWLNWHPVTVHFREATRFGRSIVFMPRIRWFGLWRSHPVVAELRELSRTDGGVACKASRSEPAND
jgi:hypothetical protein